MFVEKLDAIQLHKFIKEIDETAFSVELKPELSTADYCVAMICCRGNNGNEANIVIYDDKKLCISKSNHSASNNLQILEPRDINAAWRVFLYTTFGEDYWRFSKENRQLEK